MRRTPETLLPLVCLTLALSWLTGCGSAEREEEMGTPPSTTEAKSRSLQELMARIQSNQDSYRSFRAECEAVVKSPLMQRPEQLHLTGEIALMKPRKIRLVLRRAGRMAIRLVGNGKQYEVQMPIFRDSYSGQYDDPIQGGRQRIHFMPDDLADSLDMQGLFWGKPQVLKAYPSRWDLMGGSLRSPVVSPPVWAIDSLDVEADREVEAWVQNSLLVDRRTEQIRRIDKFRADGSLRVRIWHLNPGLVRGGGEQSVRMPGEVMMWYPPPLEGTIIRIRFSNRQINIPIPKETFFIGD